MLGGACLRVWRHRSRGPQKRLCRRRAVGVGLLTCGEGKLVSRAHTLVGRSAQVVYELQVLEEEKVREEMQELERESQGEEQRSDDHDHVDGVKDSLLEPRCVCR